MRPGGIRNGAAPRWRGPSDLSRRLGTDGSAADLALRPNTAPETAATISHVAFRNRFLIQIAPVAVAALAVLVLASSPRKRLGLGLALLAILLLERTLEAGSLYAAHPNRAFYPPLSVLAGIPRGQPYRFASLGYSFIPNVAALYGLEDVRGYEAMTFTPLFQTYPMWCTHQPVWYNRVDDPSTPFLSFLNVRWVLFPPGVPAPDGWTVRSEGEEMRLLENPRALPRAFVPRLLLAAPDPDRRLAALRSVTDFAERGVVSEAGSADWIPNGDAEVSITGYAADRIALDVLAREAGPRRHVHNGLARMGLRARRPADPGDFLQPRIPGFSRPGGPPPSRAALRASVVSTGRDRQPGLRRSGRRPGGPASENGETRRARSDAAAQLPDRARNAKYANTRTSSRRMNRPTAISRLFATGRVPFALMPVMAATAVTSTASPSQTIQFTAESCHRAESERHEPCSQIRQDKGGTMRFIGARLHGYLDIVFIALFVIGPLVFGLGGTPLVISLLLAAAILVLMLVTGSATRTGAHYAVLPRARGTGDRDLRRPPAEARWLSAGSPARRFYWAMAVALGIVWLLTDYRSEGHGHAAEPRPANVA